MDDTTPQSENKSAILQRRPRLNECADDYPPVLGYLDDRTRVAECAAGLQWIIQKRVRNDPHRAWEAIKFNRSKVGLLRNTGNPAWLQHLPDWFSEEESYAQSR